MALGVVDIAVVGTGEVCPVNVFVSDGAASMVADGHGSKISGGKFGRFGNLSFEAVPSALALLQHHALQWMDTCKGDVSVDLNHGQVREWILTHSRGCTNQCKSRDSFEDVHDELF